MKAVVIHEHGGLDKLCFEDFPDPTPGPEDVLLRVRAVGLNYLDIFTRRGLPGVRLPMPMITGGDIAGEVAEVGDAVEGWQPGARALVYPLDLRKGTMLGENRPGGLCEYVAVPARMLMPIPDAVPFEEAASLPVAYGTALRMLERRGTVQPGERVLVLGASGGVGTGCVQIAKMLGAEVVACAGSEDKAQRLLDLGADHVVNYVEEDFVAACEQRFGKHAIDVAVNFTGGDTWAKSLRLLKYHGRQLTCGATAGFSPETDLRYIWTYELQVVGSTGWRFDDQRRLLEFVEQGRIRPVIDRVLPLADTAEGERLIEDREVFGKVIITP